MTLLRLDPPIWLDTVDRGPGYAHIYNDNGIEGDAIWTVFICEGEFANQIWNVPNDKVRACKNYTASRPNKAEEYKCPMTYPL